MRRMKIFEDIVTRRYYLLSGLPRSVSAPLEVILCQDLRLCGRMSPHCWYFRSIPMRPIEIGLLYRSHYAAVSDAVVQHHHYRTHEGCSFRLIHHRQIYRQPQRPQTARMKKQARPCCPTRVSNLHTDSARPLRATELLALSQVYS